MYVVRLIYGPARNSGGTGADLRAVTSLFPLSKHLDSIRESGMSKPHVRTYPPHFDSEITQAEAEKLASDPSLVASHPFYPFLERNQHWSKFAKKGASPSEVKDKDRAIRYAARRDAYIFS